MAVRGALFDDTGLSLLVTACEKCDAAQSRITESVSQACLSCKLPIWINSPWAIEFTR